MRADTDKTLTDQILEAQTRENDIENIKYSHTKDIPALIKLASLGVASANYIINFLTGLGLCRIELQGG